MADSFGVQASVKLGQHMINVRGDDTGLFLAEWDAFVRSSGDVIQDIARLDAAYVAAAGLTPAQAAPSNAGTASAIKDDPGLPPGVERPNCEDCQAPMRWSQFTSKANKLTKMWKCSANDKHAVQWPGR